jgi:hypothetical protein
LPQITVCCATGFFDIDAFVEGFGEAFGATVTLAVLGEGVGDALEVVGEGVEGS